MLRHLHAIILTFFSASLFAGCTAPTNQRTSTFDPLAGQYTIKGGGGAMPAVKSLTDAFARAHAGVTFDLEDVGSDGGVGLTAEGAVDLGMISRDLKPAEVGQVETLLIGTSATGVVVNASNPVHSLTRAQLRDIFSGTVTDWALVGGEPGAISVFVREPDSSTRVTFDSYVFAGKSQLTHDAVEVFEIEPMLNAVRGLKGSIGMATTSQSTLGDSGVHFVAVDGVAPTADTIKSGDYPIRRPLYITYRAAGLKPAIQAFLAYVRGPEAQRLAASL